MILALQVALILACLFYGARKGGVALGLLGGIGVVVLVFGFRLPPGKPPADVMLTIVAVVAALATLLASGGLDVLLQAAERLLRRRPRAMPVLAPPTPCALTMLCGTGHVVCTMLPIIYDVAIKNGIRPERPMAAASIASQMGIIASPVSVAVVSLVAFLAMAPAGAPVIDFVTLLSVTIPPTLFGVLMIGLFSMIAVVAVFGVAWMADTVFEANLPVIKAALAGLVKAQPWAFALALLLVSKLVNSQAAAISALVPVGLWPSACRQAMRWPLQPPATATTSCPPTPATWPPACAGRQPRPSVRPCVRAGGQTLSGAGPAWR